MKRGNVLAKKIVENKVERLAEIGVFKCRTARTVLRDPDAKNTLKEYWAVDMWAGYYGGPQSEWEKNYYGACRYMAHFPQLRVVRLSSLDAASIFEKEYFPHGYFDLVFIDGSHVYENISWDLKLWTPLVKSGGIVCGHDYDYWKFPDVKGAVDNFFGEENITKDEDYTWFHTVGE